MLDSRVKFSPLKSCLLFDKSEILSKTYSLVFLVVLTATAGCASIAEKSQMSTTSDVGNSEDKSSAVILSALPTMHSGESGVAGDVVFKAGDLYSSAAGLTCKTVTLSESFDQSNAKNRVVCDNGKNWFFIANVFQADEIENNTTKIEIVKTAIGSLK